MNSLTQERGIRFRLEAEKNRRKSFDGADRSSLDGRDELNLAEFPLTSLADRVPKDQKTLVFEDSVWDRQSNKPQTRRLTISASDRYGLPTALDDEVILGLVQLTRQMRFTERTVSFTRYELLELLGWRQEGKSYRRLDESLRRWLGVTLYYDKAWWDKQARCWIDAGFHILDQITLSRGRGAARERAKSTFTWNEIVFRSFESGYLKQLDLALYRSLHSSIAKRMFRFLDKRFYHRGTWEFALTTFACEHIGVSRGYDAGQLKRRLMPAIEELEHSGFLRRLNVADRFQRIARGHWQVRFQRGNRGRRTATERAAGPRTSREQTAVRTDRSPQRQGGAVASQQTKQVEAYLKGLSDETRLALEFEALKNAPAFLREGYERSAKGPHTELFTAWQRGILEHHVQQILSRDIATTRPLGKSQKVR